MAKKNKQPFADYNASINPKSDRFGTVWDSMLKSKAWQSLTCGDKYFYIMCRVQSQSEDGKRCLYMHGAKFGITYNHNKDFVFPREHLLNYGFDNRNSTKSFKRLAAAGFIEYKECNKPRQMVNVYSFSDKWKHIN